MTASCSWAATCSGLRQRNKYSPVAGRPPIPRHPSPLAGIILDRLFLGHNLLTGHIPTFIEGMQIGTLDFSSNYLSGVRPGGQASDQFGSQVITYKQELRLLGAATNTAPRQFPDERFQQIERRAPSHFSPSDKPSHS